MTEKRFVDNGFEAIEEQSFTDTETDKIYFVDYFDEIIDLLNNLAEENEQLKKQIKELKVELDTHKHPLWSTREAERKVSKLTELLADEVKKNGELLKENNLLRIENKRLLKHKEGF